MTTAVVITEPQKHFRFILFNHIYGMEKKNLQWKSCKLNLQRNTV